MRFFVHDPECGDEFFDTAEEAKAHAESLLDEYRDGSGDGWNEIVTNICWGEVREQCVLMTCVPAPPGSEFDEIWDFGFREVR